jgi:polyhydroxyalkanoate synthesis regulator phasin
MAQRDVLKRYLDAGLSFTAMTTKRAEEIARELVKAGELQRDQVQNLVDDLIDRSRRNSDHLVALVRKEVSAQLGDLGGTLRDELRNLEKRLTSSSAPVGAAPEPEPTATSEAPAKKARAKKAVAEKFPAAKAVAEKFPAAKVPAAKVPAAKVPAAKAPGEKTAAKKAAAKKTAAKAVPAVPANKATKARKTAAKASAAGPSASSEPPADVAADDNTGPEAS